MKPTLDPLRRLARVFTYPLQADDFAGLVSPLASGRQLRGVVTSVEPAGAGSVTVSFRPASRRWHAPEAGQWVRVGVEIDGVRHWRSYSLSSAVGEAPAVTVRDIGLVSGWIVNHTKPGDIWFLDAPQGEFTLPEHPRPLLMLTAGSGITPVMAMLRTLLPARPDADVVVLHSIRTPEDALFADDLDELAARHPGLRVVVRHTSTDGRLDLGSTDALTAEVPDWRSRAAYACGPAGLVDDARTLWAAEGVDASLTVESFTPPTPRGNAGEGGRVAFLRSDKEVDVDGSTTLLQAGEDAGILMPSGCRMGICRTCLTPLAAGRVRDLVTGEVHGDEGELIRTCVSAPAGDVRLDR